MISKNEYYFDTNCFYKIGKNSEKIKYLKSFDLKITTSYVAVAEIQRIVKVEDFKRKQSAMYALDNLVDEIYVAPDFEILPKAYGLNTTSFSYPRNSIKKFIQAKSISEIDNNINKNIINWKTDWHNYMNCTFNNITNDPPSSESELFDQLVVGWAFHAKLISKEIYELSKRDEKKFNELKNYTKKKYTGSLDVLFKFIITMLSLARKGQQFEKNRIFDIEFFFHMRKDDINQIFVTTEKELIAICQHFMSDRIKNFDEIKLG
jgi:hypothetical protein